MPSRREQIAMTPEEVRAYLEGQRRIVLVTIGADGMPHAVPMNYGLDDAGRVLITAFATAIRAPRCWWKAASPMANSRP